MVKDGPFLRQLHCVWGWDVAQGRANFEMKNETKKTTEGTIGVVNQISGRRMVPEFISRAMLMQQPDDLVGMGNQVGGKFQRDHSIDPHPASLGQIQQPASQHMARNAVWRVMFEWDKNQFGRMPRRGERLTKIIGQDL